MHVQGKGVIEGFAWETEGGFSLHLLNYTNPNMHKGWMREIYPIGEQRVRMELPRDRKVSRIELLRAERDIPFKRNSNHIEFVIPAVEDYEVAALYA